MVDTTLVNNGNDKTVSVNTVNHLNQHIKISIMVTLPTSGNINEGT